MQSIEEVRSFIRKSARQKLREAMHTLSQPPSTFSEFRRAFSDALYASSAPEELVHLVSEETHVGGPIFNIMYEVWLNVQSELSGLRQHDDIITAWREMVDFYVYDAIIDIVAAYGDDDIDAEELATSASLVLKMN